MHVGFSVPYAGVLAPKLATAAVVVMALVKQFAQYLLESVGFSRDAIAGDDDLWQSHVDLETDTNAGMGYATTSLFVESYAAEDILFDDNDAAEHILDDIPTRLFGEIQNEQPEELCAVCLCELEGSQEVTQLPYCAHIFHKDCIDGWVSRHHRTCPLCRSSLVTDRR